MGRDLRHPWKAEDLTVATWYEPEKMYCNWDEAGDDYFQRMIDNDEFCVCCGVLDDAGACPCSDWDDDCFIGKARPWDRGGWYADLVKLTAKGKRLRAECRAEMRQLRRDLARRTNIRKRRRHWMVVKDAVDARRIALYWQEQTQRRLCAADGEGRAADAAAFRAEF